MYHFQTGSYGAHKACDKYLSKFEKNMDKYLEVMQGRFGKIGLKDVNVKFNVMSDETVQNELVKFANVLMTIGNDHGDLMTIRDEMLADVYQFKYLLTFK